MSQVANIDIESNNPQVPTQFDTDSGNAVPVANVLNILGQQASSVPVMYTTASGNTIKAESRAWQTQFVVDSSTTAGLRGTYSTIQAAINDAVSGQNVYIRPGTYTEDIILKSGVNLIASNNDFISGPATIKGKIIDNGVAVSCTFGNLTFLTNADFSVALSAGSTIKATNCYFRGGDHTIFDVGSSGTLRLENCTTNLQTTGIALYNTTGGTLFSINSTHGNDGNSTTTGTHSSGNVLFAYCTITNLLATSSSGAIICLYCVFGNTQTPYLNNTWLTTAGTGTSFLEHCQIYSGTASAISAGSGTTIEMYSCVVNSSNTNAITGSGTVKFSNISFVGSSSLNNSTTQIPQVVSNNAVKVKSPGAYPYTTVPQDYVILVDTSSARTINLNASPVTGQTYRIKDNVGSAATNNITITPAAGNIDGAGSTTINVNYGSVDVVYNGTQWNIL